MVEFLDMGKYAAFIWSSYAAAAALLVGLTAYIVRRNAATRDALQRVTVRVDERRRDR